MGPQLTVLAWHNIESTWHYPAEPRAGIRGFERQISWLRRLGNIVPLVDSIKALRVGRELPDRAIALTFDDGYKDTLSVLPALEYHGLPATFFLVPDLLEGKPRAWWETLAWAFTRARPRTIEWCGTELAVGGPAGFASMRLLADELKVMDRATRESVVAELVNELEPAGDVGLGDLFLDADDAISLIRRGFEIGSHSMHHAILSRESVADQRGDLMISRGWLESLLDVPIEVLAYPNGRWSDFDQSTVEAAEAAGYYASMTAQAGRNVRKTDPHRMRRIMLEPHRGFADMAMERVAVRVRSRLTTRRGH